MKFSEKRVNQNQTFNKMIRALFIFEILGRPPEHIKTTLEEFVTKISEQKGIKINRKHIHEPKPVDDEKYKSQDIYTTFAEVEMDIEDINLFFSIIFNMLPSNVEIIEPEELRMKSFELNALVSDLIAKLHRYDEIAKTVIMERNILLNKIKELKGEYISPLEPKKPDKSAIKSKKKKKNKR